MAPGNDKVSCVLSSRHWHMPGLASEAGQLRRTAEAGPFNATRFPSDEVRRGGALFAVILVRGRNS